MAIVQAVATFPGAALLRAAPVGPLRASATFAGAGGFSIPVTRGTWRIYANFSGHGAFTASFRGRLYALAAFAGAGVIQYATSGPVLATARLIGRGSAHFNAKLIAAAGEFIAASNAPAATVDITSFTDADYAQTFQWQTDSVPFDFTDHSLIMMVRKIAEDDEVFLSIESILTGIPAGDSGIDIYRAVSSGPLDTFDVIISRADLAKIPPGDYVHSLILVRPDGLREDIWRGTLTNAIGPTR